MALVLIALFGACRTHRPETDSSAAKPRATQAARARTVADATLILVGIDGFRWDYLDRPQAENLRRLAREGVRAERLIPSFPSKTFPNHYTIATGLYPGHHGIVANTMYDPEFDASFSLGDRSAVQDGRWWGGEPIWVTAERQGRIAAAYFWPGTEAEIDGVRPSYWKVYDDDAPGPERVRQVLEWLRLPAAERPAMITLYFSDVDSAGHTYGPDPSPQLDAAISTVDERIGELVDGLASLGGDVQPNLLLVSDHGMAATSSERVIVLDDHVEVAPEWIVDLSPVLALRPPPDEVERVYDELRDAHPSLAIYRRNELPEAWRYRDHRRITPIVGVAEEGWTISVRSRLAACPTCADGGTHGYAPELPTMGGLFVAWGPSFARGRILPPIANVHLYELMCAVLGLEPAPNDGDLAAVDAVIANADRLQ